ncbi:MAG TPA: hypothetical protein VG102_02350 [Candidatus Paceibacterota bacterium]|nr:hypothetical protein [Candidatus Paceibacterota bacterium]
MLDDAVSEENLYRLLRPPGLMIAALDWVTLPAALYVRYVAIPQILFIIAPIAHMVDSFLPGTPAPE